jgi:hypothetical protein
MVEEKMKSDIKEDNGRSFEFKTVLNLKKGDRAKIRSRNQIEKTLDHNNQFQGCGFMESMWQYCEGTYTVLKRVEVVLDPWKNKLRRCHDTVALDGLFCHGDPIVAPECDRTCIFYWKEAWLEKMHS